MPDWLRDQVWAFVAVVVAVVIAVATIVTMVVLHIRQRQHKSLSYEVISVLSLLRRTEEVEAKIEMLFNEEVVRDIHLAVVRIVNSGNVSIKANDYERPLSLNFGEKSRVLSAEVSETVPSSLHATVRLDGANKVVVEPVLLNAKDSFKVKVLVSQPNEQVKVDARVEGVKEVGILKEQTGRLTLFLFLVLTMMAGLGVGASTAFFTGDDHHWAALLILLAFVPGVLASVRAVFRSLE